MSKNYTYIRDTEKYKLQIEMSEQTFNKVFQLIQECLVPKTQLEEYQNKILHLESMLQKANIEVEKLKSESIEQKLSLEITQAEKESLQAEKKAIEVKFNEVSLKLKQKTHQYDLLLKSQTGREQTKTEKLPAISTGTPNVKQEPIGIVNLPVSLPSKSNAAKSKSKPKNPSSELKSTPKKSEIKTGTKRQNTTADDSSKIKAKRTKAEKPNLKEPRFERKPTQCKPSQVGRPRVYTFKDWNPVIFTCEECLGAWGKDVECYFRGNPDSNFVPEPKIQNFQSFQAYLHHLSNTHGLKKDDLTDVYCDPNNQFGCKICDCRFESEIFLDMHIEIEHAHPNLTKRQFFDLYLKYKDDISN